jgi:hypothetical protein
VLIGVGKRARQRIEFDLAASLIDARDGVLAAVGHPGGAVATDDDAVRRRAAAERNLVELAACGIEASEKALGLAGEPDRAVGRRRDIMRIGAARELIVGDLRGPGRRMREAKQTNSSGQ